MVELYMNRQIHMMTRTVILQFTVINS